MPGIDISTLKLSGYDFYKFMTALFFLIPILSCNQSRNKIEGTWTVLEIIETEKGMIDATELGNRQLQFLENGEMRVFKDNKRTGLGIYYYNIKGDSLYLTNIEIDTFGKVDTLARQRGLLSFKNDTMNIKHENKTYYYKKAR